MPRALLADESPTTFALVSRLGPYEVTSMALAALGGWSPHARPGGSISMIRRRGAIRRLLARLAAAPAILGLAPAGRLTGRIERFTLTAVAVDDPAGLVQSHVFVESTLTGRAAERAGRLCERIAEPASAPARRGGRGAR